jgi:hypothetical protein
VGSSGSTATTPRTADGLPTSGGIYKIVAAYQVDKLQIRLRRRDETIRII